MPTTVPIKLYRTTERANAAAKAAATEAGAGAAFGTRRLTAAGLVEELWERLGFAGSKGGMACQQAWPAYDESKTIASEVTIAVQVGGKLKATVTVPMNSDQEAVLEVVKAEPKIAKLMEGKNLVKVIHVPNKLMNLILK